MAKFSDDVLELAKQMRNSGMSYSVIAVKLQTIAMDVWTNLNRARYNEATRDSSRRYRARGFVAIVDLLENKEGKK